MTNSHADTLTATDAVDAAGFGAYDTPLGITNPQSTSCWTACRASTRW